MKNSKNKKLDFKECFNDYVPTIKKCSLDKNGKEKNNNSNKNEVLSDEKTYLSIGCF